MQVFLEQQKGKFCQTAIKIDIFNLVCFVFLIQTR